VLGELKGEGGGADLDFAGSTGRAKESRFKTGEISEGVERRAGNPLLPQGLNEGR
jgi:hypothetical protein